MTYKTEHPMRLKRLNRDRRLMLAKHAAEKFRCAELRLVESKAHADLTAIMDRDAQSIPVKEIAVLEKHGFVCEVKGFRLPQNIYFRETGERKFTRPDGVEVTREGGGTRCVRRPDGDEYDLGCFGNWGQALSMKPDRPDERNYYGDKVSKVTLPKRVKLPGSGSIGSDGFAFMRDGRYNDARKDGTKLDIDNVNTAFMSEDVLPAMAAYYVAADARIREERRLIVAAIKVIASCDVYGQVLDFWPEAAEIEEKLFEGVIPNAFSMVALSDDDKAALCRNMASRGVESPVCQRDAA